MRRVPLTFTASASDVDLPAQTLTLVLPLVFLQVHHFFCWCVYLDSDWGSGFCYCLPNYG